MKQYTNVRVEKSTLKQLKAEKAKHNEFKTYSDIIQRLIKHTKASK